MKVKKILIIFCVPVLYFIISLFVLRDYGINWDDSIHYDRGQAYFHFLTTGHADYGDLSGKRSYFQSDTYNGKYYLKTDSAHPPTGDILSAAFNYIFYQKLNILGDIESYHLFIIFISSVCLFSVVYFAYEEIGLLGAIVSGLALVTYPLFFGESHFNIKDPAETTFFTLTIFAFWKSLRNGSWKWLILSLVSCAFALGTKFNIVFLPFILIPYLVIRYWGKITKIRSWFNKISISYKLLILFSPFIVIFIFILFWPYLWSNPVKNFIDAVKYYKDIGTGGGSDQRYLIFSGINLYSLYWILSTTPPFTLFLTLVGITSIFFRRLSKAKTELLWVLWLLVPIIRVSLPDTVIYGGVRQIMEFIPAMALMTGLGAKYTADFFSKRFKLLTNFLPYLVLLVYIPQIIVLYRIHPNENVYFNFMVGGLKGASEKNIPYWGNSFGNSYFQAVEWLNRNAESGARLALVQGVGSNIASPQLRSDLNFSNNNWSGIYRKGEYLFEMIYGSQPNAYPYVWEYVDNVLNPIYEVKVDGVAIAKVWKNDLDHTKPKYRKTEKKIFSYELINGKNQIDISFSKTVILTRFFLHYRPDWLCGDVSGIIETSLDGKVWTTEKEPIPNIQVSVPDLPKNTSPFFFAARNLRYLRIIIPGNSCLLKSTNFEFWGLE